MSRANTAPSLADITVGELRSVLAGGNDGDTIAEALAAIAEAARVGAEHESETCEYRAYIERRQARHAEALERASAGAEVRPTISSADAWHRRQEARREAAEEFEIREPRLEFAAWVQHDRPAIYQVNAIKRAVQAVRTSVIA